MTKANATNACRFHATADGYWFQPDKNQVVLLAESEAHIAACSKFNHATLPAATSEALCLADKPAVSPSRHNMTDFKHQCPKLFIVALPQALLLEVKELHLVMEFMVDMQELCHDTFSKVCL